MPDRFGHETAETTAARYGDQLPKGRSPQRFLQDHGGGKVQRPRIPDATWIPALEKAQSEQRPIGHVIATLLDQWLAGDIELEGQS